MDINLKNNLNRLSKKLKLSNAMYKVAIKERDYERSLCNKYKQEFKILIKKIKKLEYEIHSVIELADASKDDKATKLILEFIESCKFK